MLLIIGASCRGPFEKTAAHPSPSAPTADVTAHHDDHETAVPLGGQLLKDDSPDGLAVLDHGVQLMAEHRYGEAEAALREASLLLPLSPWPHYNLGWINQELGDYEAAAWEYETALSLAPESPEILDNLILVYTHLGTRHRRRLELVDRALRAAPDPDWQAWLKLQRALLVRFAEEPQGEADAPAESPDSNF